MSLPPSPVPAPAPGSTPPAVRTESKIRTYSISGAGRVVGYGLVGVFLCDLPQVIYDYLQRPLDPAADASLVTQIVGRISIPMIGFGLIFGWPVSDAPRWERALRKVLSYFMLLSALGCVALAGVAVSAGIRQYRRAAAEVEFRANQRTATLNRLVGELNVLNGESLRVTYSSVIRPAAGTPPPPAAEMRKQIAAAIPAAIDGINHTTQATRVGGLHQEIVSTCRFIGEGIIGAVIFFVLWEASAPARSYRIFRQRGGPNLAVEGAVMDGLASVGRKLEGIRIFPDPEGWAWYRRLRRKLRHRKHRD